MIQVRSSVSLRVPRRPLVRLWECMTFELHFIANYMNLKGKEEVCNTYMMKTSKWLYWDILSHKRRTPTGKGVYLKLNFCGNNRL